KLDPALKQCDTLGEEVDELTADLAISQDETKDANKKVDALTKQKQKLAADNEKLRDTVKGLEKVQEDFGKLSQQVKDLVEVNRVRQEQMDLAEKKLSKKKAEIAKLKGRLSRCKCSEQDEDANKDSKDGSDDDTSDSSGDGDSEDDDSDSDESDNDDSDDDDSEDDDSEGGESDSDDSDDDDSGSQGGGGAGNTPSETGPSDNKAREDKAGDTEPGNNGSKAESGNTGGSDEVGKSGGNDHGHTAKPGEGQSDASKATDGNVNDAACKGGNAPGEGGQTEGSAEADKSKGDDKTCAGNSGDSKADVASNNDNNGKTPQTGPPSDGDGRGAEPTTRSSSGETASNNPTGPEQGNGSKQKANVDESKTNDTVAKRTDHSPENPAEQSKPPPQQRPSPADNPTTKPRSSSPKKGPTSAGQPSRAPRKAAPILPAWLRDSMKNDGKTDPKSPPTPEAKNNKGKSNSPSTSSLPAWLRDSMNKDAKTDPKSPTPEAKNNEGKSNSPSTSSSDGPSDSSAGSLGKNPARKDSSQAAIGQATLSSSPTSSPLPASDRDAAKTGTKTCLDPPSSVRNNSSIPPSSSSSSRSSHLPSEPAVKQAVKKDLNGKKNVDDANHSSPPSKTSLPASNEQAIQQAGSRQSAPGIPSELPRDAKQTKAGESAPAKQTFADNGLQSPVPPKAPLPASDAKRSNTSTSQGGTPNSPRPSSSTPSFPPRPSDTAPVGPSVPTSDPPKGKIEEGKPSQKHTTNGQKLQQAASKKPLPKSDAEADMAETMGRLTLDPPKSVGSDSPKTPSKVVRSDDDALGNTDRSSGKGDLPKDGISDKTTQSPVPTPKAPSPVSDAKTGSTETKRDFKLSPPRLWVTPPSPPLSDLPSAGQTGPRPETAKADSKVDKGRSPANVPTEGTKASSPASKTSSTPHSPNRQSAPSSIGNVGSAPQRAATTGTKAADANSSEEKTMAEAKQPSPSSNTPANLPTAKPDGETIATGPKVHPPLNPPKLVLRTPSPPLPQGLPPKHDGHSSGTCPTATSASPSDPSSHEPSDIAMGDSDPSDVAMGPPGHPGVELGHTDAEMTEGPSDAGPSGDVRNGDDVDMSDSTEESSHKPVAVGTDMDGVTATTTTHIPRSEEVVMDGSNETNVEHQDGDNANDTDMTDNPNPSVGATNGMVNAIDASTSANDQAANGQLPSQAFNPPMSQGQFTFGTTFQFTSATRNSSWDNNDDQDVLDTRARDALLERQTRLAAKNEKCWQYRENRNLDRIHTRLGSTKRKAAIYPLTPVQAPTLRLPPLGSVLDFNSFEARVKRAETAMKSRDIDNSWAGVYLNQGINRMKREEEEDDGEDEEDEAEQAARLKRLTEAMDSGHERTRHELDEQHRHQVEQMQRDEAEQLRRERIQRGDGEDGDEKGDWEDEDEEMESSDDDEESDGGSEDPDIDRLDEYELDENGCFIAEFGGWKKKPKT
ncbi:MAG: hypothetical protein Q9183_001603, partial [Haloplaca sp. 2 TL-2023]